MNHQRRVYAVYNTVETDSGGALDCILHAIERAMDESISREKGANQNDKTEKH